MGSARMCSLLACMCTFIIFFQKLCCYSIVIHICWMPQDLNIDGCYTLILLHVDWRNVKLFSKVTNDIAILKIRGHSTFLSILKFQKS